MSDCRVYRRGGYRRQRSRLVMTKTVDKATRSGSLQFSVAVALILLVVSGAAYRLANAHLSPDGATSLLPRGTLARLSLSLGGWEGRESLIREEVIEATDTDDHVSRTYVAPGGFGQIALFVGYGVRLRDLAPHRPEVCYSGSGWTLDETVPATFESSAGNTLGSQIHRFYRGGLGTQKMTVLNYYIVDGRYCADVSLLRSSAWRKADSNYVAQVQIACSSTSLNDRCEDTVKAFARESAGPIRACLVEGLDRARAANSIQPNEG